MNTRRKRRRRISPCYSAKSRKKCDNDIDECDSESVKTEDENTKLPHTLETLPPEVLEMILRMLPLRDVAGSIRIVSRRCSTVAMTVLNGAFIGAGFHLETSLHHVESMMKKTTIVEPELLIWSKALNALELIRCQYKMLKAVTWRYTHPPKTANFNRICFYAGSLVDEMNNIIRDARLRPVELFPNHRRIELQSHEESCACPRLASFVALCKRFMNYFEKVSECRLNRSALISGCKAVDVLDCLAEGREVTGFRVSSIRLKEQGRRGTAKTGKRYHSIVTMGLRYVMRRAWFTCLQVPSAPDETSWREDQRFMYLRLRRLVGSVNEHHFEKQHFERDLLLRGAAALPLRAPTASTYSGYGVYAGRFFYYGNMNKYAYENKFKDFSDLSSDDSQDDEDDESERRRIVPRGPPTFDLVIRVELRCSSDLAPLALNTMFNADDLEDPLAIIDNRRRYFAGPTEFPVPDDPELYLKLNVTCPASSANRLPANFTWEQWSPSHPRKRRGRFSS